MSLKDLLNMVNPHVNPQTVQKAASSIDQASQAAHRVAENVSEKGLLGKMVKAGTSAALTAGYLASILMPELTAGIAATAFLGASLYKYFSERSQQAAKAAMLRDGLTPVGPAIANGYEAVQGRQVLAEKMHSIRSEHT